MSDEDRAAYVENLKKQKNLIIQLNVLDSMEKCSEDYLCKN